MKKIIALLSIFLVSYACTNTTSENEVKLIERQRVFNECMSVAHHHSDLVRTFREKASPEIFNPDHKTTRDEIMKEMDRISISYLIDNEIEFNENDFLALSHKVLQFDIKTKNDQGNQLLYDLLDDLPNAVDSNNYDQLEEEIIDLLFSDKYMNSTDEEFYALSLVSATFIDSANYWKDNLSEWTESDNVLVNTKNFWDSLIDAALQVAYADACGAVGALYLALIIPPLAPEIILGAAAIASIMYCVEQAF
jgi:hypothetical protein